jgi:hypothetical protein
MSSTHDLLEQLSASLTGPRRRRHRLLVEVHDHLRDAVAAEMARGVNERKAQENAVARLGSAADLSTLWNADERRRRVHRRRYYSVVALATVVASGLGITQYAFGKTAPPRPCGQKVSKLSAPLVTPQASMHCRRQLIQHTTSQLDFHRMETR